MKKETYRPHPPTRTRCRHPKRSQKYSCQLLGKPRACIHPATIDSNLVQTQTNKPRLTPTSSDLFESTSRENSLLNTTSSVEPHFWQSSLQHYDDSSNILTPDQ